MKRTNADLSDLSSITEVPPLSPISNLSVVDSPVERRTVSFADQNAINLEVIKEAENQLINNTNSSASDDNANEVTVSTKASKRGRGTIATLNVCTVIFDMLDI